MKKAILPVFLCLALSALIIPLLLHKDAPPSLSPKERTLLRIWVVNAPGGGMAWLKDQLRLYEKQHPGVSTYLRSVSGDELTAPEAVLPDMVLCMPGDVTEPQGLFLPLSGAMAARNGPLREELLRAGRWQGQQYGLPLCWGAWVLAIDSALEPGSAVTPAPTTLLGRPAASPAAASPEPAYPLEAARSAVRALQAPGGAGLFTLGMMLEERPPLPEDFAALPSGEVYTAFQRRRCATALLTTGQATAFAALTSSGSGFPHRIMTAEEVITDQVWMALLTADAPREAALLLSHLTATEAQKALSGQALHTVRNDLTLYAANMSARIEQSARQSLSVINTFLPAQTVRDAAWQFFQGTIPLSQALLPLL